MFVNLKNYLDASFCLLGNALVFSLSTWCSCLTSSYKVAVIIRGLFLSRFVDSAFYVIFFEL